MKEKINIDLIPPEKLEAVIKHILEKQIVDVTKHYEAKVKKEFEGALKEIMADVPRMVLKTFEVSKQDRHGRELIFQINLGIPK